LGTPGKTTTQDWRVSSATSLGVQIGRNRGECHSLCDLSDDLRGLQRCQVLTLGAWLLKH
jgi:hypothetical protein